MAQPLQDRVGLIERTRLHRDVEWDTCCQIHEFVAISTRQIGNGSDDAHTPHEFVGHTRNRAHVDSAEDERAALDKLLECDRD